MLSLNRTTLAALAALHTSNAAEIVTGSFSTPKAPRPDREMINTNFV